MALETERGGIKARQHLKLGPVKSNAQLIYYTTHFTVHTSFVMVLHQEGVGVLGGSKVSPVLDKAYIWMPFL